MNNAARAMTEINICARLPEEHGKAVCGNSCCLRTRERPGFLLAFQPQAPVSAKPNVNGSLTSLYLVAE